jgi:RND family efflux transporter MFP subunit
MSRTAMALLALAVLLAAAGGWAGYRFFEQRREGERGGLPSTRVRRGAVTFTVNATGTLQGGNSRMLTAPMTGSPQLIVTALRKPGELVAEGDVVAEFDTTEEAYKLREAESDLAEAEQLVIQAANEAQAKVEELANELIQARSDVLQAEFECRRNELRSRIEADQNNLALADARERLAALERDYASRKAAAAAGVAIQDAARKKSGMQAETAKRNIAMMTLKAPAAGYVNIERNTNTNVYYTGMQLPIFQVGDQVRAGMAVAQIPDMSDWEISAEIDESDRGHLAEGQRAAVRVVALPGREFPARILNLGGTTGPPWSRRFDCRLKLTQAAPELRPGMSARIVITTETMPNVLSIPTQALFESDGRHFVYLLAGGAPARRDVTLVRRSESVAVIEGLKEGDPVALASPGQGTGPTQPARPAAGGAAGAVVK